MKTIKALLVGLSVGLFLVSCQKESDPPQENKNDKIFGTWNFVGMNATIQHTMVAGVGASQEKLITSYPVVAEEPKGTVTIDATTFKSNGIGYSYKTIVKTQYYMGNVLQYSDDNPREGAMAPSNASTKYTMVGSDSMRLESGVLSFDAAITGGSAAPNQTIPQGLKISWENDVLVLSTPIVFSGTQPVPGGTTAQLSIQGTQVIRLKK
jgi:hypothetical protein